MPFDAEDHGEGGGGGVCPTCQNMRIVRDTPIPCLRGDLTTANTPIELMWAPAKACPTCKPLDVLCRCKKCFDAKTMVVSGLVACSCLNPGTQFYEAVTLVVRCPICQPRIVQ